MYYGPHGERDQRRRAQGNFLPLSAEDIAEDIAQVCADKNAAPRELSSD